MRSTLCLLMTFFLLATGCGTANKTQAGKNQPKPTPGVDKPAAKTKAPEKIIITPSNSPYGVVVRVRPTSKFAVLGFSTGNVPQSDVRVSAYRKGLKVGELKITGPQEGENTVADIVAGDVQVGDEVRAE